jgi:ADP-ribose pyrophosphatase YjhB (NUDIX family)
MSLPTKHSVALVIRRENLILTTRRPDDELELPGVWGLPAGSFRAGETLEDLIRRIGNDKLGVELLPVRKLAEGEQDRATYRLEMELWETAMRGEPSHSEWRWAALNILEEGRSRGSLCCELALKASA